MWQLNQKVILINNEGIPNGVLKLYEHYTIIGVKQCPCCNKIKLGIAHPLQKNAMAWMGEFRFKAIEEKPLEVQLEIALAEEDYQKAIELRDLMEAQNNKTSPS